MNEEVICSYFTLDLALLLLNRRVDVCFPVLNCMMGYRRGKRGIKGDEGDEETGISFFVVSTVWAFYAIRPFLHEHTECLN